MTLMRLFTAGLSFLLIMLIARRWGPESLGQFSTLFSFFMFIQQLPLLGLHLSVARTVASDPALASGEATNSFGISIPVGILLAMSLGLTGQWLYPESMHTSFWLVGLACLPTSFTVVAESVLTGEERIHLIAWTLILENIFRVLLCIGFLLLNFGLPALFGAFLFGRLVAVWVYWQGAGFRDLLQLENFGWKKVSSYLPQIHTFLGILVFSASFGRLDFILLSKLGSLAEAGYYSPAYKIYELGLMLPTIICVVIYPIFIRRYKESFGVFCEMHHSFTRFLFGLGLPAAIILAVLAGRLITLFFGPEYAASASVMRLLAFAMLLMAQDQLMALVLLSSGRENLDLKTLAFSFGFNLLLLLVLIPSLGSLGAALAAFGTGLFRLGLRYLFAAKALKMSFQVNLFLSPILAGSVMALILWGLEECHIVLSLLAAVLGYLVIWIGTGGVTWDSFRIFRQTLIEGK